jgi:hypothetical protein
MNRQRIKKPTGPGTLAGAPADPDTVARRRVRHRLTRGEHPIHVILITVPFPLRSFLSAKVKRAAIHGRSLHSPMTTEPPVSP